MQVSCLAVLVQFVLLKIVTSYTVAPVRLSTSQLNAAQNNQQLLKTLLNPSYNEAQFPEKLNILSTAINQMPPKRNKVLLSELLKQSAMESLTNAANVLKLGQRELPHKYGIRAVELPGQLITTEAPVVELPKQLRVLKKIELPQSSQVASVVQNLPKQLRQFELREPNGLPKKIVLPAKEVVDDIPSRLVRIKYY